jgi:hypothetical protein
MSIIVSYALLQIFNFLGAGLNAYFLVRNLDNESYWLAALSGSSVITLIACFFVNWRRMTRFAREAREWKIRADAMLRNHLLARTVSRLSRCPELELEMCLQRGLCPDCGNATLDKVKMICTDATCGSRFAISPIGAWGRA